MKLVPVFAIVASVAVAAVAVAVTGLWPAGIPAGQAAAPAGMPDFIAAEPAKPAPATVFKDGDGAEVTLARLKGEVLVVNLWATWCAPCIEELPSLAKLADQVKGQGVRVVAISVDRADRAVVRKFLDANGAQNLEAYQDDGMALARELGVKGLPTTIIVGADGTWRGSLVGPADWASDEARAFVTGFKAP